MADPRGSKASGIIGRRPHEHLVERLGIEKRVRPSAMFLLAPIHDPLPI